MEQNLLDVQIMHDQRPPQRTGLVTEKTYVFLTR